MTREELIKEMEKGCGLPDLICYIVKRVIVEDEEVFGVYLKKGEVEIAKEKISEYTYYIITGHKLVVISFNRHEYWFKTCPLDKFIKLEEKNFLQKIVARHNLELLANENFPGKLEVKIHFDIADKDLKEITFKITEAYENEPIKKFASGLITAVSNLSRR